MNNEKLNGNKILTLLGGCFAALGALFVFFYIFYFIFQGKLASEDIGFKVF